MLREITRNSVHSSFSLSVSHSFSAFKQIRQNILKKTEHHFFGCRESQFEIIFLPHFALPIPYTSTLSPHPNRTDQARKTKRREKKEKEKKKREILDFRVRTENEHGVWKRAENGEEEASDETRAEDLQQELAAIGEVRGRREHQVSVHEDQEQIPQHRGGARQEPVRLLARRLRRRRREREHPEVRRRRPLQAVVDSIGDQRIGDGAARVGVAAQDQEQEEREKWRL